MTMQHLISRILVESDFSIERVNYPSVENQLSASEQVSEGDFMLFGSCQKPGIDNHCLAVFLKTIPMEFVTKHISAYYITLRTYLGERLTQSMIRNLSLIVCLQQENSALYDARVLEIEEDPFDFKKYVLVYTKSDVEELQHAWETSESDLIPYLNHYLHEDGSFTSYKQQTAPSTYGLVTRLFIKIPFIKLEVKERAFEDLQAVIRGHLGDNLTIMLDRLLKASPDDILKNLREMEGEQP